MMIVSGMLDHVDLMVLAADVTGQLLFINQQAEDVLGVSRAELAALNYTLLMPAWSHFLLMKTAIPTANADKVWRGELALLTSSGQEVPVRLQVLAHRQASDSPIIHLLFAHSVAGERRKEQALTRAKQVAEMSSEVRGQFLHNIANQVRKPMLELRRNLTTLLQISTLDKEQSELLQRSLGQVATVLRFVDDVVNYVRNDEV